MTKEKDQEPLLDEAIKKIMLEFDKVIKRFLKNGKCPDDQKTCILKNALTYLLGIFIVQCSGQLLEDPEVSKKFGIKTREEALKILLSNCVDMINATIEIAKEHEKRESEISLEI